MHSFNYGGVTDNDSCCEDEEGGDIKGTLVNQQAESNFHMINWQKNMGNSHVDQGQIWEQNEGWEEDFYKEQQAYAGKRPIFYADDRGEREELEEYTDFYEKEYSSEDESEEDEESLVGEEEEEEEMEMEMDSDECYDNEDDDRSDSKLDGEPLEFLMPLRASSAAPGEDEDTANTIIESLQNVLPELNSLPKAGPAPVRMTDIGFKISQLVLRQQPPTFIEDRVKEQTSTRINYHNEDENENDAFLERTLSGKRRNRTGIRGRPKKIDYGFGKSTTHVLPPEVAKLMGQANMCYVSRRYDDSVALLLEVVRRAPHSIEAYQTLGLVHEEKGDLAKALSYYVIAAHLIKNDIELWKKLAKLTLELRRPTEAIYYLSKLIMMKSGGGMQPEYFWTRARLLVERNELRRAVLGFRRLLLSEVEEDGETFAQVGTLAERLAHSGLVGTLFVQVLVQSLAAHRTPSLSVVIRVLEWLRLSPHNEYDKMETLIETLAAPLAGATLLAADWYVLDGPGRIDVALQSVPIEIQLYYAVAMTRLKKSSRIELGRITSVVDPHRHGHLMKSLGEALLANAQPNEALALLLPLMDVPNLGNPDLGILIGEAYRLIPGLEEIAISTFEAVLEICPERVDARTALSDLYRQKGRVNDSVTVLKEGVDHWDGGKDNIIQKENCLTMNPPQVDKVFEGLYSWDQSAASSSPNTSNPSLGLLHLKETLPRPLKHLHRPRRIRRFIAYSLTKMQAVQKVYHRIMSMVNSYDDNDNSKNMTVMRQVRQLTIPLIEDMLGNPSLRPPDKLKQLVRTSDLALLHGLTINEWLNLLCEYLAVEVRVGSIERAFRLTRIFLTKSVFHLDNQASALLCLLNIGIAASMERPSALLQATRLMFRTWPNLPLSLTLLVKSIWRCPPETLNGSFMRFLVRNSIRNPCSGPVLLVSLLAAIYTERFENAIRTGFALLALHPNNATGLLATAVALFHQSTKRTCRNSEQLQRRALALLHHFHTIVGGNRGGDYNVARAYHMLGLFDLATVYYRRALDSPFFRDAAFNLHLLLLQNGESELAAHIISTYILIV